MDVEIKLILFKINGWFISMSEITQELKTKAIRYINNSGINVYDVKSVINCLKIFEILDKHESRQKRDKMMESMTESLKIIALGVKALVAEKDRANIESHMSGLMDDIKKD